MKIGRKKVCTKILKNRIRQLSTAEKLLSAVHAVFLIAAILTFIFFLFSVLGGELAAKSMMGVLESLFVNLISQGYVFHVCKEHWMERKKLID